MKKLLAAVLIGVFTGLTFHLAAEPAKTEKPEQKKVVWMTDFKAAKELAAKENKVLLVDFSGSDWCGWCVKMEKEIYSQKKFINEAKKKSFWS